MQENDALLSMTEESDGNAENQGDDDNDSLGEIAQNPQGAGGDVDDNKTTITDPDLMKGQSNYPDDQLVGNRINAKNGACDKELDCCAKTVWWLACCNAYCLCRSNDGCKAFCFGFKCSDALCNGCLCCACCPCACCIGCWAGFMRAFCLGESGFWAQGKSD